MGTSMVGHLIAAGYETTVFNRSPSKTLALAAKGATVAASPAEVIPAALRRYVAHLPEREIDG